MKDILEKGRLNRITYQTALFLPCFQFSRMPPLRFSIRRILPGKRQDHLRRKLITVHAVLQHSFIFFQNRPDAADPDPAPVSGRQAAGPPIIAGYRIFHLQAKLIVIGPCIDGKLWLPLRKPGILRAGLTALPCIFQKVPKQQAGLRRA